MHTHFLGHTPGLRNELSDPHDVAAHIVHWLLLLHQLQLVKKLRNQHIEVFHYKLKKKKIVAT